MSYEPTLRVSDRMQRNRKARRQQLADVTGVTLITVFIVTASILMSTLSACNTTNFEDGSSITRCSVEG